MSPLQIYFPEQRIGAESTSPAVQVIQPPSPKASPALGLQKHTGDSFQRTAPEAKVAKAPAQISEQSTPDDLPTSAFAKLGSSVGMVFGIQF